MALRWGLEVSSFFHSEALKWVCEDHRQLRKHWSGWYENPKPDGRWGNQGSNKEALLTWWVHGWGGRGATTPAACLPPAERQCVAWLSLLCICCFPPWSGRGVQCDWISLLSKLYTHLFQEAFFLMQHPERSGQWGCALAQTGYPGQWWIQQSAQAASTKPRGLYTSLCKPTCEYPERLLQPLHLISCHPCSKRAVCQRERRQLVFPSEDAQNRAKRNTPLPSIALVPFDEMHKT